MASTTYHDSFSVFLKATNEKTVFADFVLEQIDSDQYTSILDIGPGDGQVTSMILSRKKMRYTGVEMNRQLAGVVGMSLTGEVIIDTYPTDKLDERRFDVALSLYSLPIEVDATELFVSQMIRQTSPGGLVIVVTYGTHQDGWWQLRNQLRSIVDIEGLRSFDENSDQTNERNRQAFGLLDHAGVTTQGVLKSRLRVTTVDEFFEAISFLLSAGEEKPLRYIYKKKQEILPILEGYKNSEHYELDMHHTYFVSRVSQS